MTTRRRRLIPQALLGTMTVLALGSALLGLLSAPPLAAINLQIAEARTATVSSFNFHLSSAGTDAIGNIKTRAANAKGTWQDSDRVRFTVLRGNGHPAETEVAIGSTIHAATFGGVRFAPALADAVTDPFNPLQIPVAGLPPLGLVTMAQHVVQSGDTYTFTVPTIRLAFGWVAYAPLSGKRSDVSIGFERTARQTKMAAVVKDGLIESLSFPDGIRRGRARLFGPRVWTLSNFGMAPAVNLPAAAQTAACRSGTVSVKASLAAPPSTLCVRPGTTFSITFDKAKGGLGTAGPWAIPPVSVDDPSVATLKSVSPQGHLITAHFEAGAPGTTTVSAHLDEECSGSGSDATPCTIPPQGEITVAVTVKP